MGKIRVKKKREKEEKKQISITNNIFKNKATAARILNISEQGLYKEPKDDKYDRDIEDFINRDLPFPTKFELKPYRKALCLLVDYEDTITNLFKGINYPKYKNKEKLFVETLYNCPIWELDTYFPDEEAKKEKIIELKDKYEQERDQSVRRWIKIITFYLLIGKKASKKTYNKIYDILYVKNRSLKEWVKEVIKEYKDTYNYTFINSFFDFYPTITNRSINPFIPLKNDTEFDYILKTNKNDSLNNEIIGILKNRRFIKEHGSIGKFGDIFFTERINDIDTFLKKGFYVAINNLLSIINLSPFCMTIYHLPEEEDYYTYYASSSWEENNYSENKDIILNSFFIIDKDNCKINSEIEEITKNIQNIHKTELEKVEKDAEAMVSTDISPQRREFLASEGFNLNYTFQISLGKLGVIIVDNKEFRYYDPEDYFFNI